jgi:hypothetical protein
MAPRPLSEITQQEIEVVTLYVLLDRDVGDFYEAIYA